jgi:hypothetical protein
MWFWIVSKEIAARQARFGLLLIAILLLLVFFTAKIPSCDTNVENGLSLNINSISDIDELNKKNNTALRYPVLSNFDAEEDEDDFDNSNYLDFAPNPEFQYSDPPYNSNTYSRTQNVTQDNTNEELADLTAFSETIGRLFQNSQSPAPSPSPPAASNNDINLKTNNNSKEDGRAFLWPLTGGGGSSNSRNNSSQESRRRPTPSPTPQTDDGLPWVSGQSRGYTALYLMMPQARDTIKAEISNLLDARLKEVYLGVLTDGTFGWDPDYLRFVIQQLTSEERSLTLVLYMTNGPTMRQYDRTNIATDFSKISPKRFRELIQNDPDTRETYRELVRRTRPLFALNKQLSPNGRNIAIPMLEDNLNERSYSAIFELTREVLGDLASIKRNPCPGCYEGNDNFRYGGPLEFHGNIDLAQAQPGDSLSLDGSGYHLNGELPFRDSLSISQTFQLLDMAMEMNFSYFGLWRADRQGLLQGSSIHPTARNYTIPSKAQMTVETELLRYGLREIIKVDLD